MSKVLKIAAVVVGVIAITVATAGIGAAPAIAASGAGLGAVAGASAVGASVLGLSVGTLTAIGAGLSVASSLLAKKPGAASAVGSPTDWKADPGAALPYWIGRTLNAGNLVYDRAYQGLTPQIENQMQGFVTVYSAAGPIAGFDSFLVDKVPTTFSGSPPTAVGSYQDWMWLTAQLGNQPESIAHPVPRTTMPGWTSASKLSGLASTMFTIGFDSSGKKFAAGVPKLAVVGRGVRVYDPRLDSTYPGGSGAQRSNNEATWAYSANPWLHALTWAIGRHANGIRTLGVGMPIGSIDVDAFVQAANVADANGWVCGGIVGSTDDKWNVLKQMCQAGGGEPVRQAAMLSCFVNAPKVSLATVTADDLADGDITFPAMQPRRARINSVIPTFRSEDHDWEVVPGDVVKGGTYITEDGETRTRQIDYPLVQCFAGQQPVQAAQLAAYDIVNAREYGPIPLPLKPQWIRFKNGDCLTLNIPDANLVNQTAIILKRGLDPANGSVALTFRSETAAKHAFALGKTTTAPPTPSISSPPINPYWSDPNATRNDDGNNMIPSPVTLDQCTFANSASRTDNGSLTATRAGDRYFVNLVYADYSQAFFCGPTAIPVVPNETLYYNFSVRTDGTNPDSMRGGFAYYDINGVNIINVDAPDSAFLGSATPNTWFRQQQKTQVPASAAFVAPYVVRIGWSGAYTFLVAEPYLGRSQSGATLGAPIGSPVGTITAGDVSSTINSGGGVAPGQVTTPSIVANAVTDANNQVNYTGGGTSGGVGSFQVLVSKTISVANATDLVSMVAAANLIVSAISTSGGITSTRASIQVKRGATVIVSAWQILNQSQSAALNSSAPCNLNFVTTDSPGVGTFTYSIEISVTQTGGTGTVGGAVNVINGGWIFPIFKK